MATIDQASNTPEQPKGWFTTTHWSVVLLARDDDDRAALETLCRDYWRPLYVLARRFGHSQHDAEDLPGPPTLQGEVGSVDQGAQAGGQDGPRLDQRDERGLFARTFCGDEFAARGLASSFVQCSTSVCGIGSSP